MKRGTFDGYVSVRTAQHVLCAAEQSEGASTACGAGGGESKPEEEKAPAACGSACGAGEK